MGKLFGRDQLARFHAGQLQHGLPDELRRLAGGRGQLGHHLLERIVLGGQQRTLGRRAHLWLRNRQLIVLQQRQHGFELIGRQLAQRGLTILLANKITHRLAVISLAQQLRQLRNNLARGVVLLRGRNTLVQILLGSGEMTRLQRCVVPHA